MKKQYPDMTFEGELVARGHHPQLMWQIPGPKDTAISWLQAYLLNGRIVIHQTYVDGQGWQVYTANNENKTEATIDDVLARCGLTPEMTGLRVEKWLNSGVHTGWRVLEGYGERLKVHGAFAADDSDYVEAKEKAHELARQIADDRSHP